MPQGAAVGQGHLSIGVDRGLTHFWWILSLCEANNARLKQIKLPAAIHLAFDELQLGDLPLYLPFDQGNVIAAATAASDGLSP
jgi:hypothetical protein